MTNTASQQRWYKDGYQSALRDIATALRECGVDGVKSWLEDNMEKYDVKVTYEEKG
jgi:hypothetical protein